ncbi:AAA family ATPase [Enterococcus sp. LJL51]|uniref:ATP-binding protein n=1 Tax=Enterococcus sp. LJL51 TaxID=3416656 RepID=UPI003CF8BC79
MKILAIDIAGFGKWQNKKIDFSEKNQLIYGKNEAGKSTIYQFIQAILFGFPTKGKKRKSYVPKNGGSYGGRLWLEHAVYGKVQIERFRELNKGQAKVYVEEQVGDERLLAKILHPLTKELFQSVFTFQQEQLTQLERLEEENLQTALLALGISGSDQLLKTREEYFKAAQDIYKLKGSRPQLNERLKAYQELSEKIRAKENEEEQFTAVLTDLAARKEQIENKRLTLGKQKEALALAEKQLLNYPLFEEWLQLQQKSGDTSMFIDENEQQQLLSLYQEHKFLQEELERLNRSGWESVGDERSDEYLFYLNEEENIRYFLSQRYTMNKLLAEIDWMKQSVQQNRQEMIGLENKWGWSETQPPRLFFEDHQLLELREQIIERKVQLQTAQENHRSLEESIVRQEKNLETFEAANQELFQRKQPKRQRSTSALLLLSVVIGIAGVLGGLLLTGPLSWGSWLLVLVCLCFFGWQLLRPKNDPNDRMKQQWQQKLTDLDQLTERFHQVSESIDRLQEDELQLESYISQQTKENHLGRMNRLEYWMNHKEEIKRYLLLLQTNQELRRQLADNQEESDQWLKQTERYVNWLPIVGKDLGTRVAILSDFSDEMEQLRLRQGNQEDIYRKQALKEIKSKQQDVLETARPLLYQYQILGIEDVPEKLRYYQQNETVESRKAELQRILAGLYPEQVAKEQLLTKKYQLTAELSQLEDDIFKLQKDEQRLEYKKKQMAEDGSLDNFYQEQAVIRAEIEDLAAEWSSYRLAGQLLIDLLTELSEQQLPALLKKTAHYFSILTDHAYTVVRLEEEELQVRNSSGQDFAVYDLSTGTKDQLIMSVRFAFLSLQGETNPCPVLIDDGWLHYDSQRKTQLAKLFQHFGEVQQIICFSSDQEMVSYYHENKQPVIQLEVEKR